MGRGKGTDALQLVLMAEGLGKGHAAYVPAFTFVATAEAVPLLDATPVFVDVCRDTFSIDADSLDMAINMVKDQGLAPKMVIPVDPFGQPAEYPTINAIAEVPTMIDGATSAWAQYTLNFVNRVAMQTKLKKAGVPTAVYYAIPLNQQSSYANYSIAPGGVPVSDQLAKPVLNLPMHPYLDEETQDRIINTAITAAC